ncbi:MAG: glycosyltransferase [Treponema sp.]|nr:glycosyltransferase [Treponema sp.]
MFDLNKTAVIVIWFNPKETDVENIKTYSSHFKKVFIVDNSDIDNSALALKISNAVYIPNNSNLGIAAALNTGCKNALENGFTWVMTMDQDSAWDSLQLTSFFDLIFQTKDPAVISFAPVHRNELKSVVGDIKFQTEKKSEQSEIFRQKVMTSGNIISLEAWLKVNGFNETLFIDEVDHEFCFKLTHAGYKICEFQNVIMIHTLGAVKKTILPRPCKHSGVRLFYIFRNMLYIKKTFPLEFKSNGYKKYMIYAVIQKTLEFRFKDLSYIRQGIKAFKNNQFGAYKCNSQ